MPSDNFSAELISALLAVRSIKLYYRTKFDQ